MFREDLFTGTVEGLTRHCEERSRQRGFTHRDIALVCEYGTPVADGYLLTRNDLAELLESPHGRHHADRLLGTAVIEQTGRLLTIFRSNKRWRRQATGRDQRGRRVLKAALSPRGRYAA
ncbi:hypothetical protein U5801_19145 [Lamprobacter modestohalophilus]|uniref:hypothetical protein n=1 Tax=Lamprobacter modestohalophilus TaxID=1064514 RepID=UPI002ADED264|nr:hypothetical protein [Lamprobacter modestohalophilus]MEA1051906.1 hypothetical protein [Lamprobacter modestohalophilus]